MKNSKQISLFWNLFPYKTIMLNLRVGCWQEWFIDASGTQVFSETHVKTKSDKVYKSDSIMVYFLYRRDPNVLIFRIIVLLFVLLIKGKCREGISL